MISPCGCDCAKCENYKKSCAGCRKIKGKVFWAPFVNAPICPLYHCSVNEKHLKHCGECADLPCNLYYDTKDPTATEEEHEAGVAARVDMLKRLKGYDRL